MFLGLERAFFSFSREPRADLEEKFRILLFFISKNFHKVSDGFLFVIEKYGGMWYNIGGRTDRKMRICRRDKEEFNQ